MCPFHGVRTFRGLPVYPPTSCTFIPECSAEIEDTLLIKINSSRRVAVERVEFSADIVQHLFARNEDTRAAVTMDDHPGESATTVQNSALVIIYDSSLLHPIFKVPITILNFNKIRHQRWMSQEVSPS